MRDEKLIPVMIMEPCRHEDRIFTRADVGQTLLLPPEVANDLDCARAGRIVISMERLRELVANPAPGSPKRRPARKSKKKKTRGKIAENIWVILAAGPSLRGIDISPLATVWTIAINRSVRLFPDADFALALDRAAIIGEWYADWLTTRAHKLLADRIRAVSLKNVTKFCEYKRKYAYNRWESPNPLSENINYGLAWSGTSAYPALNFAYLQLKDIGGPAHIVLAGVDLQQNDHFDSDDGASEPFPQFGPICDDFTAARNYIRREAPEIKIWCAAPEGSTRLTGFDFLDFEKFLSGLARGKVILEKR